jgi:hypothetical protein
VQNPKSYNGPTVNASMRGFGILGINGMFGFSWNNLRYSKYRRIAFKLYTIKGCMEKMG